VGEPWTARGDPLHEFDTEPASQEAISRHLVGVFSDLEEPTETHVPLDLVQDCGQINRD